MIKCLKLLWWERNRYYIYALSMCEAMHISQVMQNIDYWRLHFYWEGKVYEKVVKKLAKLYKMLIP